MINFLEKRLFNWVSISNIKAVSICHPLLDVPCRALRPSVHTVNPSVIFFFYILQNHLSEMTLVIKWFPLRHSSKSGRKINRWLCFIFVSAPSSWFAPRACPISCASNLPTFKFSFILSKRILRVTGESLKEFEPFSFQLTVDRCLQCRPSQSLSDPSHQGSPSCRWKEQRGRNSVCVHPSHCW